MNNPHWKPLEERMARAGVRETDLTEQFVRSGGKGGQNVNKVSTCVLLVHRPSGLQVRCETERTQAANRYEARLRLVALVEHLARERAQQQRSAAEKIRRRNRPLSRGAKRRRLEAKRHQSQIKQNRRVRDDE